jgi:NADH dehydrogenase [ubiquinone] 1 alpha subcomplex assembly factor 5
MNPKISIFDRKRYKLNKERAAKNFHKYSFLYDESSESIRERIADLRQKFNDAFVYGGFSGDISDITNVIHADIIDKGDNLVMDEENINIANEGFDLVVSNLSLHFVNDVETAIKSYKDILRPSGIFLGVFLGGNTLTELRQSMAAVDMKLFNGLGTHVIPMIDIKDAGRLVQKAGFKMPVADTEYVQVEYDNISQLYQDLKGMGQGNCLVENSKKYIGKTYFKSVEEEYRAKFSKGDKITATFELIAIIGKK